MNTDELEFGPYVRECRKAEGLSLRELATAASIDFTYLSKVVTGKFPPPSGDVIARLAGALGADVDVLLRLANKVDPAIREFVARQPDVPRLLRALKEGNLREARRIIDKQEEAGKDVQEP